MFERVREESESEPGNGEKRGGAFNKIQVQAKPPNQ